MDFGLTSGSQLSALAQFLIVGIEIVAPILFAWSTWDSTMERMAGRYRQLDEDFDFIVVGGGSSGSLVANRLSANHKVLLIEAGGTPHPFLRIPIMTYFLHGIGAVDWKFKTVPQKASSFGLKDQINLWPAGKGLGGSSSINGMISIRGNVQGFDILANITGNPIWSMENMLKIYKDLEDYHGYFDDGISHGKGGDLSIEKSDMHKVTMQLLKAGEELGYPIRDPNPYGPVTEGFAPMDFYLKMGRRWSSYEAFLRDIMESRKNLTIMKFATATKVLFDNKNRAFGVEYIQDGIRKYARATKEVILSAGSIQSAKLLMLSGIGPRKHLQELGINVRVDAPVGEILQDKYGVFLGPFVTSENTSFLRERDITIMGFMKWLMSGTGSIQCSRAEATYTWSSSYAKKNGYEKYPDLHTYFMAWSVDHRYQQEMSNVFNMRKDLAKRYYGPIMGRDSFFQMVTLNKVFGTGTLRLKNKDPMTPPLLDPKYLQNRRDMDVLLEGVKFAVDLVEKTKSFAEINATILNIPFPGCEQFLFKSDPYWECYARHITVSAYKYCATAPMGKDRSDPEAVVDSELRVLGTNGLRVIDASVLQVRHQSINHWTLLAMAEVGTRFILNDWKKQEAGSPESFKTIYNDPYNFDENHLSKRNLGISTKPGSSNTKYTNNIYPN